jgi:hypothetical protein
MPGLRRVAPELPVHDMGAALEYYTGRLGFDVAAVMPNRDYAIVERDDVALHLFSPDSGIQSAVSIHVFATGLDELFSELERRGALISQGISRDASSGATELRHEPGDHSIPCPRSLARHSHSEAAAGQNRGAQ